MIKYFSLFSGIGGFELGIQREDSEAKCVGFSEINKYAIQVYKKQFPSHKNYGDATQINTKEIPNFDLLVGGFPCQPFSVAGKRQGFEDARGTMFFEILRILKAKKPRYFILENVKGLLSHEGGETFEAIIRSLAGLGYGVEWSVLNSKYFGVPQSRERIFIVGYFRRKNTTKIFPISEVLKDYHHSGIITGTLTARYPASQREGAYIEEKRNGKTAIRKLTPIECERLQGFPDNWTQGISDTQRYKCLGNAVTVNVVRYVYSLIKNHDQQQ